MLVNKGLLLLGLVVGVISQALPDLSQHAVLHTKAKANQITIREKAIPKLSALDFDDKAVFVCFTGVVLMYEAEDFNSASGTGLTMEYGYNTDNECFLLKNIQEKLSSIRFAGHMNDFAEPSITLYQHINFQGEEVFVTDEVSLPKDPWVNHASLIITGRGNWTLFDQPNYKGYTMCLYFAGDAEGMPAPVFMSDTWVYLRMYHGWARSIRKGCNGDPAQHTRVADMKTGIAATKGIL